MWCITNDQGDYWSNEWGWGSKKGCTIFTYGETQRLNLPFGGKWKRYN